MNIIKTLQDRYSTKEFDKTKKFTAEQITSIEDLLQLSPSSTNIQPWQFVVATTDEGKNKIAKSADGFYSFNKEKITDASAVVVFATQVELTDEHLSKVLEKEDSDGRFAQKEFKEQNHGARSIFANMHKFDLMDYPQWAEKQVYLNVGNFLLGVAALGFDAIAMEGVDFKILDEELGFREKGYTSSVVISVGYRKESDFNKDLPKSRLDKKDIIKRI